jgi:hypothetical protein
MTKMRSMWVVLLLAAMCSYLTACGPLPSPRSATSQTVLDEKLAIGAEASYQTANLIGSGLVSVGVLTVDKFKTLDNAAYTALEAVRAAYDAGDASSYAAALARLKSAVQDIKP